VLSTRIEVAEETLCASHPNSRSEAIPSATLMLGPLASSIPCRASERGCGGSNVLGVILLVFLGLAAIVGILSWVWSRWERGPFPLIMRIFGK
jgi:hypothetical protein